MRNAVNDDCNIIAKINIATSTSNGEFYITTAKNHLDEDVIFNFLTKQSYWSKGITKEIVEKSIKNTPLCFGLFDGSPWLPDNKQIGFARVISDLATFAYLADVFVLEEYRGLGLGKWLVKTVVEHKDLQGLRKFMLATFDAHSLYARHGFKLVENPGILMEIIKNYNYGACDEL